MPKVVENISSSIRKLYNFVDQCACMIKSFDLHQQYKNLTD